MARVEGVYALGVSCPICGARAGSLCRSGGRWLQNKRSHDARIGLAGSKQYREAPKEKS